MDTEEREFEAVFAEHWLAVCRYVARRSDHVVAEDVAAQVFTIAWRRRARIPADGVRPWLLGVARKVLANEVRAERRRWRRVTRLAEHEATLSRAGGDVADAVDTPLLDGLRMLPERDREILLLVCWDGLTAAEAARAVGCSHAAARARLSRARRRLRDVLASGGDAALSSSAHPRPDQTQELPC